MNRYIAILAAGVALLITTLALAAPTRTSGEVRRIDTAGGKITIKHGAISNLNLPPMTLVFHVSDPAMLESVQPGDQVRFYAEKIDGQYTITSLEK